MFAKLKAALAALLGRSEAEVHTVVAAFEQDMLPLLDDFRTKLVAELKVDEAKLAKFVAAEVAKILGNQPAPAPVEPPAGS